jgi:iron complex transport system permease protein|tara:strand:+ start:246 stop:1274 length:1029 start_codon:yes stop_codon:yes gene_type:complete
VIQQKSYRNTFILLSIVLIAVWFLNITLGSIQIPFKDVFTAVFNGEVSKDSWKTIIQDYRIPKAITAVLVGSGLSISGLLMQTLFRNPLAGPFVLGISSGASLGVALLILGSSLIGGIGAIAFSSFGMAIAASLGAFLVLSAVLIAANKVRNTMSILIIGLMFGSLTSAIISVLAYFSSAEQLQQFIFWGFGSLGNLSWNELLIFTIIFLIGISLLAFIIKPLNSMLLGENYAKSLGINIKQTRNLVLIITSILTGVITAFSGPIAFVGLAVPHLTKLLFNTSNHKVLLPAVTITGAILMLIADIISQLPTIEYTLPINAITSLFGAPIVIWLLVRKRKIFI